MMQISIGVLVFIVGTVLLLSGILRGNFKIFGAEVKGKISNFFIRLIASVLGLVLILFGILLFVSQY